MLKELLPQSVVQLASRAFRASRPRVGAQTARSTNISSSMLPSSQPSVFPRDNSLLHAEMDWLPGSGRRGFLHGDPEPRTPHPLNSIKPRSTLTPDASAHKTMDGLLQLAGSDAQFPLRFSSQKHDRFPAVRISLEASGIGDRNVAQSSIDGSTLRQFYRVTSENGEKSALRLACIPIDYERVIYLERPIFHDILSDISVDS